jgi:GNAT superfamily N-acetyltransferase
MALEEYEIRNGRREDAPDAARLWMQSAREHADYDAVYETSSDAEKTMRRFLADLAASRHSFLFVAVAGSGEVVGFISGELREGSPTFHSRTWASVDDVFVAPDHRGNSVGRSLLDNVTAWARERKAHGVSLQ